MRTYPYAAALACLFLAACGGGDDSPSNAKEILYVSKASDDGSQGTLRWAIEKSNAAPGQFTIELVPTANTTLHIQPLTELPAIKGPAKITGPWTGEGMPRVILDGSAWLDMSEEVAPGLKKACPGQNPGQYGPNSRMIRNSGLHVRDSKEVEISGFEVRNFCIGIMLHRASNNYIHHMRLYKNVGTSGILLTGDDETPAGGPTVGLTDGNRIEDNYFLNNPDGLDTSRGVSNTTIRRNTLIIDEHGLPSSGMEATSDGLILEDNIIQGFATALMTYGANNVYRRNQILDSALAIQHYGGTNNVFEDNTIKGNRAGIAVSTRDAFRPQLETRATFTRNLIFDNGKDISYCGPNNTGLPGYRDGGVCYEFDWDTSQFSINMTTLAAPAVNDLGADCEDGLPDCQLPQNRPQLSAASRAANGYVVNGELASRPNERFVLEFFASRTAGPKDRGEGEVYVGQQEVTTNAEGMANFTFAEAGADPLKDGSSQVFFTAIATRLSTQASSDFSLPVWSGRP